MMETNVYLKEDYFVYECPNCKSEITGSDKHKELALASADIVTETCPECGEILTLKLN